MPVPQLLQKYLLTGFSKSDLEKIDGFPSEKEKSFSENTIAVFGCPPVIY